MRPATWLAGIVCLPLFGAWMTSEGQDVVQRSGSITSAGAATVIVGGTLIDGTGAEPITNAVVVIQGKKIAAVGREGEVQVPAGARRIDVTGKYIIPGLMDANVHLFMSQTIEVNVRYEGRYEDAIEEALQVGLKNGLTTVFDSHGPLQAELNVRERLNRGEIIGSRFFLAGNIVGYSGPFGRDRNPAAEAIASRALVKRINRLWEENVGPDLLWMTPEQVRLEIQKYIARGIDFLKYAASGHGPNFLIFSPEAQRAIVEECHRAGITAQTHTSTLESLRQAIEAGVDLLQHMSSTGPIPIPESTIKLILDKKVYCAVQPRTRRRLVIDMEQAESATIPSLRVKEALWIRHVNEVRLIQARAPLLLATDAVVIDPDAYESMHPKLRIERPTEFGEGHFLWFKAMVEKGMTPMETILSATRNIAAAYRKLDELGTVEKAKWADLVVLDADPLQDVSNIRKISLVMKEGQVVDRDKLPIKKVLTVPRTAAPTSSAARN